MRHGLTIGGTLTHYKQLGVHYAKDHNSKFVAKIVITYATKQELLELSDYLIEWAKEQ